MTDTAKTISRRSLLRAGGLAGLGALAGCMGSDPPTDGTTTTTAKPHSVFESVQVEGKHLVCLLPEDHDVSRVNLIAPDGTRFTTAHVPVGVTRVELELLDIEPSGPDYVHYSPGIHQIVAIMDGETVSREVDLHPNLQIVDIRQYRAGDHGSDYGKLAVEVRNIGTAPTWVYEIAYLGAPNWAAQDELTEGPGLPHLEVPVRPEEALLLPSSKKTYVGVSSPLLFRDQEKQNCAGEYRLSVIVGSVVEPPITEEVVATVAGDVEPAGLNGKFTCSQVRIERTSGGSSK